jgi:hypothetical protein
MSMRKKGKTIEFLGEAGASYTNEWLGLASAPGRVRRTSGQRHVHSIAHYSTWEKRPDQTQRWKRLCQGFVEKSGE